MDYTYDLGGLHTSKTVGGVTHITCTPAASRCGSPTVPTPWFFTMPMVLKHSAIGYYITNLQGDVTHLVDANGTPAATYEYDPYGNVISAEGALAQANPLRYRGYYYDIETEMYYLQSRYYDPAIGRFINADSYTNTDRGLAGFNMFAYCGNNPVMGYDPSGEWSLGTFLGGASLLATGLTALAVGVSVITCGAAAPLMVAVAAVTASAGTLTVVNGAAEIAESVTGYNVVRDGAFGGNNGAYDFYRNSTKVIAEVGTMICGAYTAAKGGSVCFVAGTMVLTSVGEIPIEEIQAGDSVWAWDEETGDVALKPVVETYVNETDELVHIHVNGEEIVCTPAHLFYSPVKGWTDAVHLRAGDILVLVNGEYVVVEKVQHEILESPIKVYNFQVKDYHTYYVTNTGVLVHNTCGDQKIYRYGGTNPGNLTPRKVDVSSGLSFSTIPKEGAAQTTIEAVNSTGILQAVKDGATHVTVKPVGATVLEWFNAGSTSIWTRILKSIVSKF